MFTELHYSVFNALSSVQKAAQQMVGTTIRTVPSLM
jgi:hypothetical protein